MHDTIFAYTPPGAVPPFFNLREDEEGRIFLTVRGCILDGEGAVVGSPIAEIEVPLETLAQLGVAAVGRATGGKQPILMLPTETPPDVANALNATLRAMWPVAQRMSALEQELSVTRHFSILPREAPHDTVVARPQPSRVEEIEVEAERMDELVEQAEEVGTADQIATGLDNPANYTVEIEDGNAEAEEAGNQEVG